ncbi:MAG: hypothetical protein JW719_12675 [Pirellulales bacterium]|nr:hypothetical protein [Pirellulales bacterium]
MNSNAAKSRSVASWTAALLGHGYTRSTSWVVFFACLLGVILAGPTARAAERWQPFLEGLRQRGMHDVALAYLDRMAADPRCPADLGEVLDYEAGITLMAGSRTSRLMSRREQALDDARTRLQKFLAEHPDHELASPAAGQLANVLVERGRFRAEQADWPTTLPARKEQLLAEARGFYTEAHEAFQKAAERTVAELKAMRDAAEDASLADRRKQLQTNLLRTRLFMATAVYEIGRTYPPGDRQRRAKLAEAAAAYNAIYEQFAAHRAEPLLAGFHARLWEGCCWRDLGQNKKALAMFDELLARLDDAPATRELRNQTLVQTMETLVKPEVRGYKNAIEFYQKWKRHARGADESSADGLMIQCLAAEAYLEQARGLDKGDGDRTKLLKTSRRLLRAATRFPGAHQAKAKAMLLDPLLASSREASGEPADFAGARDRADAAKDRMQAAELSDRADQGDEDAPNDDASRAERIAAARDEAIRYYRAALALATPETPVEDLNLVRFQLAYLYWTRHDRYDAAVLGEFVGRRYPESLAARQATMIALVAYAELYNQSPAGHVKEFARQHMMALADHVTERWPGGSEAGDAWITLIHTAVIDGNLDVARGYLAKLPEDSPRRGEAEMMLGRAYWSAWIEANRRGDAAGPDEAAQAAMLADAERYLTSGVRRGGAEDQLGGSLAAAVHALAQIHLLQNQPDAAVKLLDDPVIGAMTLVRAKHPAAMQEGYDIEIQKTALRAYVAAGQLDKAESVMDALENRVAATGDRQAAARLTEIYLALSRELQDTLEMLRRRRRTDELTAVSRGFELFLKRIADRKQGNTFASMNWVAGTLADLGARFDTGGADLAPEAKSYYEQAVAVYDKILDRCRQEPAFAPDQRAIDGVKVRSARGLRRLGRFAEALGRLVDVLQHRNRMVDAQIEAAYVYQDWAAATGNAQRYLEAIAGGCPARRKDGTRVNVVWGWGKLANLVFRSQSRLATFHEARYNLAYCRFQYAMTLTGQQRDKTLALAEKDVTVTQLLSPTLGGEQLRRDFDDLLKKIQSVQGRKPVGLNGDAAQPRK